MTDETLGLAIANGQILTDLIDLCPDGIIGVERSGVITIFNQAAARLTRRTAASVLGRLHIATLYGSDERARQVKRAIHSTDHGGSGRLEDFETSVVDSSGSIIPIRLSAVLLRKGACEVGSVGFFHDLTVRKTLEDKLRKLSITDGLTGLLNQRCFHMSLSAEIERAARYHRSLSLICFDLDNFKACNDRFGHLEGDNLLRMVGALLSTSTRNSDTSFRYGGDEFFVILPETDLAGAIRVAEKIRHDFNALWPFEGDDGRERPTRVTLSMGVTQWMAEVQAEAMIKGADLAMFSAKRQGGDRIVASGQAL